MHRVKVTRFIWILVLLLTACGSTSAEVIYESVSPATLKQGDTLPAPTDEVILTVKGKIGQTNVDDTAQFDLAMLESMGLVKYEVLDPFAKKPRVFTGVLLSQLLEMVGAEPEAQTLELVALNEYKADLAVGDTQKWPVLFALQADGAYIPPDDGGPAIIIFPFDDYPEIDHATYDPKWVWSMTEIVVK
jgi:hypothetical protein